MCCALRIWSGFLRAELGYVGGAHAGCACARVERGYIGEPNADAGLPLSGPEAVSELQRGARAEGFGLRPPAQGSRLIGDFVMSSKHLTAADLSTPGARRRRAWARANTQSRPSVARASRARAAGSRKRFGSTASRYGASVSSRRQPRSKAASKVTVHATACAVVRAVGCVSCHGAHRATLWLPSFEGFPSAKGNPSFVGNASNPSSARTVT